MFKIKYAPKNPNYPFRHCEFASANETISLNVDNLLDSHPSLVMTTLIIKNAFKTLTSILLILISYSSYSQDSLLNILSEEITREKEGLATQSIPPYYIDYRVDDINSVVLST